MYIRLMNTRIRKKKYDDDDDDEIKTKTDIKPKCYEKELQTGFQVKYKRHK